MRLVADGLTMNGFDVRAPEHDGGCPMPIAWPGARCTLSVSDWGLVDWEHCPWASGEADPEQIADMATMLLTGRAGQHLRQGDGAGRSRPAPQPEHHNPVSTLPVSGPVSREGKPMDTDVISLESLQSSYPGWEIFEARGLWWAVRPGDQEWFGPRSLILRLVADETLEGLASRLGTQRYLESLTAEELAAVYRRTVRPIGGDQ
jgi:hypothetical protein